MSHKNRDAVRNVALLVVPQMELKPSYIVSNVLTKKKERLSLVLQFEYCFI